MRHQAPKHSTLRQSRSSSSFSHSKHKQEQQESLRGATYASCLGWLGRPRLRHPSSRAPPDRTLASATASCSSLLIRPRQSALQVACTYRAPLLSRAIAITCHVPWLSCFMPITCRLYHVSLPCRVAPFCRHCYPHTRLQHATHGPHSRSRALHTLLIEDRQSSGMLLSYRRARAPAARRTPLTLLEQASTTCWAQAIRMTHGRHRRQATCMPGTAHTQDARALYMRAPYIRMTHVALKPTGEYRVQQAC